MRFLSDQSFTSIRSLMWARARASLVPIGTSSVTTATSPSKSMPSSSLGNAASAVGAMKSSEPPW